MQIRVKLLCTPEKTEDDLHAKYTTLSRELSKVFNDMDYLPFFKAPTKAFEDKSDKKITKKEMQEDNLLDTT